MNSILTIDPGVDGAMALNVRGRPTDQAKTFPLDLDTLTDTIVGTMRPLVIVEKLQGTGGLTPAALMINYGEILGICRALGVRPLLVPPQTWQKAFKVSGIPYAERKKRLHELAKLIKPKILKPQADALMIMEWANSLTIADLLKYA